MTFVGVPPSLGLGRVAAQQVQKLFCSESIFMGNKREATDEASDKATQLKQG